MPVEYDFFLDGHGFMLQDGGTSIATVNNPPGLRTAGGNVLREYGQWTEEEWSDFAAGAGQRSPSDNGFLHSSGDTVRGGWRLGQRIFKGVLDAEQPTGAPSHGAHFAEYGGYVFMGIDNKLRILKRHATAFSPTVLSNIRFTIQIASNIIDPWMFSWYDTDRTAAEFPFEGGTVVGGLITSTTIKENFKITGLAVFGDYLALVISDSVSVDRDDLYLGMTGYPINNQTPNKTTATGLYLVDIKSLLTTTPTATQAFPVGCTGYFVYDTKRTNIGASETIARYWPDYEAVGCKVVNGLLWFWSGHSLFYTGGSPHHDFTAAVTSDPSKSTEYAVRHWAWYGVQISSGSYRTDWLWKPNDYDNVALTDRITGIVSLQGGTVSETVVYVATTGSLYALVGYDDFFFLTAWGSRHWWNGIGAIAHGGDAYFPVDSGLVRVTPTGQIIQMGLDQLPARPSRAFTRHSNALVSIRGMLVSMAEVPYHTDSLNVASLETHNIITRAWVWETQGWHPIASRHPADSSDDTDDTGRIDRAWMMQMQGAYYETGTKTLWFVTSNGHSDIVTVGVKDSVNAYCMTFPDEVNSTLADAPFVDQYRPSGWLVLPPFDAGAIVLEKDWNSVALYGSCFSVGSSVEAFYRHTNGIAAAVGCVSGTDGGGVHYANAGWTSLGLKTFTAQTAVVGGMVEWSWPIPRTVSSTAIELKFRVVRGTDVLLTPHIQAVRLQHHDAIKDYFRFNISINLPSDCLYDRCRVLVPNYDFYDYDAWVRAAICKVVPVAFTDVDGQQYYVRVETASRRTANPGRVPITGQRSFDVTWSLVLTELSPDSLCDIPAPT